MEISLRPPTGACIDNHTILQQFDRSCGSPMKASWFVSRLSTSPGMPLFEKTVIKGFPAFQHSIMTGWNIVSVSVSTLFLIRSLAWCPPLSLPFLDRENRSCLCKPLLTAQKCGWVGRGWMGSHTHTHTHTHTNTRRVPLRHAATIWLDSPCCCLDLPYFNRWWLDTAKSTLSWPCNAGISKGIFWGPFADTGWVRVRVQCE